MNIYYIKLEWFKTWNQVGINIGPHMLVSGERGRLVYSLPEKVVRCVILEGVNLEILDETNST